MIHICYGVSDKKGTYTKFAGASIHSIFENTKEWITIHYLHDHTLSTDNRRYLMQMVRSFGQQIIFHDMETGNLERWQKHEDSIAFLKARTKGGQVNQAVWYPLFIGETFADLDRLIFLDADTIINMDIAELWNEETGENGLAAVPDTVIQEGHFSMMVDKGLCAEERYFNSGVLLFDMKRFGRQEGLLEKGVAFLKKYDVIDYRDQNIFNYFFGEKCRLLPVKYNTLVAYEMLKKRENIGEAIYHYAGGRYAIDAVNNFHRLFLEHLTKTPWCNADFLSNMARQIHQTTRSLMLGYANFIAGMRRIVIGEEKEEEKLKKMLIIKDNEEFMTLKKFNSRGLRLEPNEILIFFVKHQEFESVKKHLESCGCAEGVHFINGNMFIYRDGGQDAKILKES